MNPALTFHAAMASYAVLGNNPILVEFQFASRSRMLLKWLSAHASVSNSKIKNEMKKKANDVVPFDLSHFYLSAHPFWPQFMGILLIPLGFSDF